MTETFDMSEAPPSPGAQLTFYGQAYIVEAVEPHTRKDGRPSAVIHWCTECASCKLALVRFKTGLRDRIDVRRCPECIKRRRRHAVLYSKSRPHAWKGRHR